MAAALFAAADATAGTLDDQVQAATRVASIILALLTLFTTRRAQKVGAVVVTSTAATGTPVRNTPATRSAMPIGGAPSWPRRASETSRNTQILKDAGWTVRIWRRSPYPRAPRPRPDTRNFAPLERKRSLFPRNPRPTSIAAATGGLEWTLLLAEVVRCLRMAKKRPC